MKYKKFGSTGLLVSELGLGTAQIGGPSIINGKPLGAKSISDDEAYKILSLAADSGINFYDSSDKYGDGLAEKRLGDFFKGRSDVFIATKCGFDENGERRFDRKYVTAQLEGSLKRLRRERVDIFQLVKPTLSQSEKEDIAGTMEELKKQGKIAFAGISVGEIEDGFGFLKNEIWDAFQIIYNALTLDYKPLLKEANKKNKATIIRSPLSGGMLTGRFSKDSKFSAADDRASYLHGKLLERRCDIVAGIKGKYDLDNEKLTVFSLNFLLSDPDVSTVIPGATSVAQMETNLKVLNEERFAIDEWNEIFTFLEKTIKDI